MCAQSDPLPFEHNVFDQYPLIVPQPRELLAKNIQVALIGSRPRAFQRAMDEPCTLPLSPPRVAQNSILLFLPLKFKFCLLQCFFRVKTAKGNVVARPYIIPLSIGP